MNVVESTMPRILLLVQVVDDLSAIRIVHALAAYWKFEYSVKYHMGSEQAADVAEHTHILIHYREKDSMYEEWCLTVIGRLPGRKVLLVDNVPKKYGEGMQAIFGVRGIGEAKEQGKKRLRIVDNRDQILTGIDDEVSLRSSGWEMPGAIDFFSAQKLLEDRLESCFLSRMDLNYCLSVPLWQFGTPGFSHLFQILRNFLFFADGRGHFSPYPYVSLRIDDFPLTSEQFLKAGGVCDKERNNEVRALCEWSEEFNARLEFMVNSKVMESDGTLSAIDHLVPKSVSTLRSYFERGVVNINAHGRSHLDEECFRTTGKVSPLEFPALDATETEEHLADCINFIARLFGKKASGFVPPCWRYREHLTKKQCSKLFSFVIDSAANYRTGSDWPKTGFIDNSGMIHLLENWHLGSRDFDHTDRSTWRSFIGCGIPVQMMAHGLYLSEPVPSAGPDRVAVLLLYAAMLPLVALLHPGELLRVARAAAASRSWDRLGLLRKILVKLPRYRKSSVHSLLQTGYTLGVRWSFAEELAEHLRDFAGLTVNRYCKTGALHSIEFSLELDAVGPFLFHLPMPPVAAELDGTPLAEVTAKNALELAGLRRGCHTLTVRMQ